MILKFRAWNKIDKVMITDLNSPVILHGVLEHDSDDIIMQFTGLTDKNGKDIYLGDVVKARGEHPAEITFNFGTFLLRHVNHVGNNGISISDVATDRYKVIGNIHQHPELIGGNNND